MFSKELLKETGMKKQAGLVMLLAFIMVFGLTGCYERRERAYYSDVNNFITEEAVVDNIIYNEKDGYLVFWLSEIDEAYSAGDFILREENARLLVERGVLDKVAQGDVIVFTSAPRFFGDGYFMPIVSLSVAGEELLRFDEGYENLMQEYR